MAAAGLVLPAAPPVNAAERVVPVIDGFGPYKLGMTLEQAKAADKGARPGACADIAGDRQCLVLKAEVFQEPAVLYAVLDSAGARVERVVARLDPQLTRRRAYRCVRLTEKVFALLVVVYGSRYKQSYDQNRKPLPAVAWDGEESGRLVFEAKCRTHEEGNPTIRVVERYPEGKKPPQVAEKKAAPSQPNAVARAPAAGADRRATIPASRDDLPPPPPRVPVGVVEETALGPLPSFAGNDGANRMARLTQELEHAKGMGQPASAKAPVPPPVIPPLETQDAAKTLSAKSDKADHAPSPEPAETVVAHETSAAAASSDRYTVPVDVAPPPAEAAPSVPQAVAIGDTEAPKSVANAASPPVPTSAPAGTVDPGPERIPEPPAAPAASRPVPPAAGQTKPVQTARRPALEDGPGPASDVRPPSYGEAYASPEPTDLEAPEPLAMPEEEGSFRRQRDAASAVVATARSDTEIDAAVRRRLRDAATRRTPVPDTASVSAPAETAGTTTAASGSVLSAEASAKARRSLASEDRHAPAAGSVPPPSTEDRRAPAAGSVPPPSTEDRRAPAAGSVPPPSTEDRRAPTRAPAAGFVRPAAATAPAAPDPARAPQRAARPASTDDRDGPDLTASAASTDAGVEPASDGRAMVHGWADAQKNGFSPVMTGGWRYKAPVPPARPWRERTADSARAGTDA